MFDSVKMLTLQ